MVEESKAAPFMELRLAGGLLHKFATLDAVASWVSEERAYWEWLNNGTGSIGNLGCVREARQAYLNFFNQSQNALGQAPENVPSQIEAFAQQLSPRGPLLRPSAPAALVDALRDHLRPGGINDEVMGVCAVIAVNRAPVGQTSDFQGFLGNAICTDAIAHFTMLQAGVTKSAANAVTKELNRSTEAVAAELVKAEARIVELEARSAALLQQTETQNTELAASLTERSGSAVQQIEATDALYRKALQIKAPVEYWDDKATQHRKLTVTYRRWMLGAGILVLGSFVATYGAGWWALVKYAGLGVAIGASKTAAASAVGGSGGPGTGANIAMTLYVAGFVAAITAVLLWAIRIMVRLYMSQHHLTIDADERAAMLKTFLALSEQEKVSENDLALILAAVFRPTPDGIIRDDGAPTFSTGGLLSVLLDAKKA